MKWNIKRGRIYRTQEGTTRAHLYYWVRHEGVNHFEAGYYGFGREITYLDTYRELGRPRRFSTVGEAKRFCEAKDRETILIEEVIA
jgi:hypothetical protein